MKILDSRLAELYELSVGTCRCKVCNIILFENVKYCEFCKPPGYIYFVQSTDGECLIKIGRSTVPQRRIRGLRSQSPSPLKVLLILQVSDSKTVEKQLHEKFASIRRSGSEYFSPTRELLEFIVARGGSLQ